MKTIELILEYKMQIGICATTDYEDKKTVKANNKAVGRMYEIVGELTETADGLTEFSKLLEVTSERTNIWVATHILEKFNPSIELLAKALRIIEEEAKTNIGFEYWLKDYREKSKKAHNKE